MKENYKTKINPKLNVAPEVDGLAPSEDIPGSSREIHLTGEVGQVGQEGQEGQEGRVG